MAAGGEGVGVTGDDEDSERTLTDKTMNDLRRSERMNKGIPADRYSPSGNQTNTGALPKEKNAKVACNKSILSKVSSKSSSKVSILARKKLELELEQAQKLSALEDEMDKKRLLRNKKLLELDAKVKLAEVEEQLSQVDDDDRSHVSSGEDERIKKDRLREWVEQTNHDHKNPMDTRQERQCKFERLKLDPNRYESISHQTENRGKTNIGRDNARPEATINFANYMARQALSKDLPLFNGNPNDWVLFSDQFYKTSQICGFSNEENMSRLQKCLRGEALETVRALLTTNNVQRVMDILESRFGRPEYIIEGLLRKVSSVSTIKEENPGTVISYANMVTNLTTTILSLKRSEYLANPQLKRQLVEKLPPAMRLRWGRNAAPYGDHLTLNDFSMWLENEAMAATLVYTPVFNDKPGKPQKVFTTVEKSNEDSSETNKTGESSKDSKKCVYCNENHALPKCSNFQALTVDERWNWTRSKGRCFGCLVDKHQLRQCKRKVCGKDDCKRRHHPLLHNTEAKGPIESRKSSETPSQQSKDTATATETVNLAQRAKQVLLKVLPVTLRGPAGQIDTYALLDDGSSVTMLDEKIADSLGLHGPVACLRTEWTNNVVLDHPTSRRVALQIKGPKCEFFSLEDVRTMKNLALARQSVKLKGRGWTYLDGLDLPNYEGAVPTILIGEDNAHLTVARRVIIGSQNTLIASLTALGWVLHGNYPRKGTGDLRVMYHRIEENDELDDQLKKYWSTEEFGVTPLKQLIQSDEEQRAIDIFEKTTCRKDDRWETGLLWKHDEIVFPESKTAAVKRLKSLDRRAQHDPSFGQLYQAKLDEFIIKGYARRLTPEEESLRSDKIWYLPHFAVSNINKPGKIRLVFDAAAKNHGTSLNDVLLKGPDRLNNLVGVFFKFREGAVAVTGDIKAMFPQIKIREEDQVSQRFVMMDPATKEVISMVMTSMIFGATSSPFSAQAVMVKNAKEFQSHYPEAVKAISEQHYMDDYLDSFDNVEQAVQRINDVSFVHARGGFEICNWVSNSTEVLDVLPANQITKYAQTPREREELTRVLGIIWQPKDDYLTFTTQFPKVKDDLMNGTTRPTKREVLRIVMSVFDPLGLLTIVAVRAKILLQDIWREGIQWDQELSDDLTEKWINWIKILKDATTIQIQRHYILNAGEIQNAQLHVFCDASGQAFAAVGYLRLECTKGTRVVLVMAKSRVAPLKLLTIPRLELQAAVMGSRLIDFIGKHHRYKIQQRYLWTDSQTVLQWLRADARKYQAFVAHRITEILDLTTINEWRWIPTAENVADDATRDRPKCNLRADSRWFTGPNFLYREPDDWPVNSALTQYDELTLELKKEFCFVHRVTTHDLIDVSRFSRWTKLVRSMAWVRRFLDAARNKSFRHEGTKELVAAELERAECDLLKKAQNDCFGPEIQALRGNKPISSTSRLLQASPVIDERGLLRVNGRIQEDGVLPRDIRQPIILDDKHPITRLIIYETHHKAGHIGREKVLNDIRQKFYVLKIRKTVKSIWNDCQICKIRRAAPKMPLMGPLPEAKTASYIRPFTYTGVDYFGPMYVKIGRRREKRYGALFTCLTVRAVHIEIAASLTTDSMIMALRRMMARRGKPKCIYSDNGTNFRSANTELKAALDEIDRDKILQMTATERIEWRFIPPGALHMGGAWERLVGSVKRAIATILHEQAPREEVLQTLMAEAEYSVNSRPLTYVSDVIGDYPSLTPNHFLPVVPESSGRLDDHIHGCPGLFEDADLLRRKQWRTAQRLADQFWQRWIREYLPTINLRKKWHKSSTDLQEGDIVIIWDETMPRNRWHRGEIIRTFPGKDGHVRSADVRTVTGIFRRPTSRLCFLGLKASVPDSAETRAGECERRK